ncbi:hypothetical protein [Pseudomonas poae]|uniref:hypothetical protein n=1 Tax=Pseudomonas poae TaxID=200451 RepID=UPI0034D6FF8A
MITLNNKISATAELISQKTIEQAAQKAVADSYYRKDFFSLRINVFITNAISDRMQFTDPDANYRRWFNSLQAAYNAKYTKIQIDYLIESKSWLEGLIPQVQSAEALRLRDAEERAARKEIPLTPDGFFWIKIWKQ